MKLTWDESSSKLFLSHFCLLSVNMSVRLNILIRSSWEMEKSVYDILHLWNDPDAKYCWFSIVSTVTSGLFLDHTRVQSLIKFIIIYWKMLNTCRTSMFNVWYDNEIILFKTGSVLNIEILKDNFEIYVHVHRVYFTILSVVDSLFMTP